MEEKGDRQRSLTDADTRELKDGQGTIVGFNLVLGIDGKHKLIVDVSLFNCKDLTLLPTIIESLMVNYGLAPKEIKRVLADAGFHTGKVLALIDEYIEESYINGRANNSQKPEGFRSSDFVYDAEKNCYVCHNKEHLTSNGTVYNKKNGTNEVAYTFEKYTTDMCSACPFRDSCLKEGGKEKKRIIEHSEYKKYIDKNAENLQRNPDAYKRRKGLCEHPFGTLKRSYGMYYTNRKGILNVLGEYSLACLVYNMKRTINIMGHENTMALLQKVA